MVTDRKRPRRQDGTKAPASTGRDRDQLRLWPGQNQERLRPASSSTGRSATARTEPGPAATGSNFCRAGTGTDPAAARAEAAGRASTGLGFYRTASDVRDRGRTGPASTGRDRDPAARAEAAGRASTGFDFYRTASDGRDRGRTGPASTGRDRDQLQQRPGRRQGRLRPATASTGRERDQRRLRPGRSQDGSRPGRERDRGREAGEGGTLRRAPRT